MTDATTGEMPLVEHLAELRMRLIRAVLAIALGAVIVIAFYDTILGWMLQPFLDMCQSKPEGFCGDNFNHDTGEIEVTFFDPIEGVTTRFKVAGYGGFALALPVVLWQLWQFVVPALHKGEKRYAAGFVASSTLLFILGGVLAFTTLGRALGFLIEWAGDGAKPNLRVASYIRLVTMMIVAFGIGFTLPVLLVFLQLLGVVQWRTLLKGWRYAIVGTFVVAAAITPSGDPISLLALSVPLIVFYFVAILIGRFVQRRRGDE